MKLPMLLSGAAATAETLEGALNYEYYKYNSHHIYLTAEHYAIVGIVHVCSHASCAHSDCGEVVHLAVRCLILGDVYHQKNWTVSA